MSLSLSAGQVVLEIEAVELVSSRSLRTYSNGAWYSVVLQLQGGNVSLRLNGTEELSVVAPLGQSFGPWGQPYVGGLPTDLALAVLR